MSIGTFAFITIALFMVHEFEEIIFVRRYIEKYSSDNRYHDEMFIAGQDHYPSTAAIAAMIGEEFIVACLILFSGVIFDSIETVTAIFIAYILHLILHIREAFIFLDGHRAAGPQYLRCRLTLLPYTLSLLPSISITSN